MKNKLRDSDGDIDVSWYTLDDLLNLAFDRKQLTQLDHGDMVNVIRELAIRLQRANNELHLLGS